MTMYRRIAALLLAALLGLGVLGAAAEARTPQQIDPYRTRPPGSAPYDPSDPGDPGDPGDPKLAGSSLPFTGGDVIGLVVLGLGLAGAGYGAVAISRRRRHDVTDSQGASTAA